MISDALRCIFVHIPKTGGSSIEDVLWPEERSPEDLWMGFVDDYHNKYQTGGLQHLLARQIRHLIQTRREKVFAERDDSLTRQIPRPVAERVRDLPLSYRLSRGIPLVFR